jgi:hypothetical protein
MLILRRVKSSICITALLEAQMCVYAKWKIVLVRAGIITLLFVGRKMYTQIDETSSCTAQLRSYVYQLQFS